jgi:catechol 2,3-dioxygenase
MKTNTADHPTSEHAAAPEYGIAPSAYRLPAATHVGAVRLQVSDLVRSVAYYQQLLGLHVSHQSSDSASLTAHGDHAPLIELRERRGAEPVPRRGRLGLYHFALLLPERAALGRFLAHLATHGVRAGMSDHLVSEAIYLSDPDGLGIEVYADRPRSQWRVVPEGAARQLAMATEPLDVDSLLAAAEGEQWSGMPGGTRMGHVHLHVGDIERATRFYHEALGFDKIVWSYPGALFLSAGGYHHHLGTNTWAAGAAPAGESDARLLEWEVVVPDVADAERVAASLDRAGFATSRDGEHVLAADPWGTVVRVRGALSGGR